MGWQARLTFLEPSGKTKAESSQQVDQLRANQADTTSTSADRGPAGSVTVKEGDSMRVSHATPIIHFLQLTSHRLDVVLSSAVLLAA